ncbi:MAG: excinuclease ABC subunit UvrC [Candidatus Gastranaerophilales bacterium]|nr:excinuclease ABC subunit UvrC [Candidatus Gastranaerophilales bacterium]
MENLLDISAQLKLLPKLPGVYLMHDKSGEIIYIGKAKNLKNRVTSYFKKHHDLPKLRVMVPKIIRFEFIVTDSEVEALILESHLIKKHKPCYNVLLKDDKKFPWFVITDDEYPRIIVTRKANKNPIKGKYFGPYTDSRAMYATLDLIKKLFPLKQCKTPRFRDRVCIYHQIGKCSGVCQKLISPDDYKKIVEQVELFLSGKQDELARELQKRMEYHAKRHEFEKAARYRDSYLDMMKVIERQKVVSDNTHINWDMIGFAKSAADIGIVILKIRAGRLTDKKEFEFTLSEFDTPDEILRSFITDYYSVASDMPKEVMLPFELEDTDILQEFISKQRNLKLSFSVPKAQKKFELLELANKNASLFLERIITQKAIKLQSDWNDVGVEIQTKLNLNKFPHRMECFDISHIQGTNTVASMVVFENGRPKKSDYKRFKIRTLKEGKPDDFESMREVVKRRYGKSDTIMPDLIIVDGGKGQLSSAVGILEELGYQNQDIVSLAKKFEEVFIPGKSRPVIFDMKSQSLFLFQKIRDEAHRFAINYHRKLRENQALTSVFDEVKGLSQKKKKLLFETYTDIKSVAEAPLEDLQKLLGEKTGQKVYNHFR